MNKIYIFVADGFEEVEGLTVVDLLRRAELEVVMVSITKKLQIDGAHGIQVMADALFEDLNCSDGAMLVLPGGMPGTLHLAEHVGLVALLKETHANKGKIAAICAAPSILGEHGILEGRRATCYPTMEEKLTGAVVTYNAVEVDEHITTSRGLGTALAFSLELIRQLKGEEKAEQIKNAIVYL